MDTGSAIIAAVVVIICTMPFIVMHYNMVKKDNKMLRLLKEMAERQKCKIIQSEFCGDFVIGLDEGGHFVFFVKQKQDKVISAFVDLSEIQTCQPIKNTRLVKTNGGTSVIIERMELCFIPIKKNKAEAKFEIYDEDLNIQLSGELQLLDKWSEQINDLLKNKAR